MRRPKLAMENGCNDDGGWVNKYEDENNGVDRIMKGWRKKTVTDKDRGSIIRTVTGENEKYRCVTGIGSQKSSKTTGIGKRKAKGMTVSERMVS